MRNIVKRCRAAVQSGKFVVVQRFGREQIGTRANVFGRYGPCGDVIESDGLYVKIRIKPERVLQYLKRLGLDKQDAA